MRFWQAANLTPTILLSVVVLFIEAWHDQGIAVATAIGAVYLPGPLNIWFALTVQRSPRTESGDFRKMTENVCKTCIIMVIATILAFTTHQVKPDQPIYLLIASVGAVALWMTFAENLTMWHHYRYRVPSDDDRNAA